MTDRVTYDALVVVTPKDFERLLPQSRRLVECLPVRRLIYIGSNEVGKLIKNNNLGDNVCFIDENDVIPFSDVHRIIAHEMRDVLNGEELPRGITGWYYQQFLKMQYARICEDEYYMVWDGDTVPCKRFSMFSNDGIPYFDMKTEYHQEYFDTISKLFPAMGKIISKSFISEHMLINAGIMEQMLNEIEANSHLIGDTFYEKIMSAVGADRIQDTAFSEFETYGTYVALNCPTEYKLKDWHSIRYGSIYFNPEELTNEDLEWLGHDFDAISFEKNQEYIQEMNDIFMNPVYREKLTPRQIIEIIQDSSDEGMKEEWDDGANDIANKDEAIGEEYLLFNYLGDSLLDTNPNQAYLCYENAAFLSPTEELRAVLNDKKHKLINEGNVSVNKTSIVIVSYNAAYLMQQCIESIRKYCSKDAYNIVVVDNASTDGVTEYLKSQSDITLILSDENLGFPAGCNVGIKNSDLKDDILLLNNDTRMTHNALFWLRMGLYENDHVGATGSIANYCGIDQLEDVTFSLPDEYVNYGAKVNVLMKQPYEEKNKLGGFSMLMKREAFDKIGALEEAFTPGYFEDDDISTGIHVLGYRLLVCHNSFIYHAGSQSFIKRNDLQEIFDRNHQFMIRKWKYDSLVYSVVTKEEAATLDKVHHARDDFFRILEVGAGSGNMISRIHYLYPQAAVYGIEANEIVVKNGVESLPLLCLDWQKDRIPFPDKYFDYIIFNSRGGEMPTGEKLNDIFGAFLNDNGMIITV